VEVNGTFNTKVPLNPNQPTNL